MMILDTQVVDKKTVDPMKVLEGVELVGGRVNTDDEQLLANIRSAIRLGHPQIKPQGLNVDRVAIVGGGPSLESTLPELRQCLAEGVKVVTVNGAYGWCIERNIIPTMQIVMDARETNARFLIPELPRCHYVLASQCHPLLWNQVKGRKNVWIYHVGVGEEGTPVRKILDDYYLGNWHGVGGGTTVGTRALVLLRLLGYLRFDLFGMDSCWLGDSHHAYAQPENADDKRLMFRCSPTGSTGVGKVFYCAPWHVQQAQDFLQLIRFQGNQFGVISVHGEGLLAEIMRSMADVELREEKGAS